MGRDPATVMRLRGGQAEQEHRRHQSVVETALDVQQLSQPGWHSTIADQGGGWGQISRHDNGR